MRGRHLRTSTNHGEKSRGVSKLVSNIKEANKKFIIVWGSEKIFSKTLKTTELGNAGLICDPV
jgi:hypothetical protein